MLLFKVWGLHGGASRGLCLGPPGAPITSRALTGSWMLNVHAKKPLRVLRVPGSSARRGAHWIHSSEYGDSGDRGRFYTAF